ncbi:MAG: hypothetical protein JWN46_2102 [Acidimicrobiales bacterium]|nr:hypothetical protein [Acidimicrobiales bacterium]
MAVSAPDRDALRILGDRTRPLTRSSERVLPAPAALAPLLPDGGLRRGSTVATGGSGATLLALALAGAPTASGSWVAVVGMPALGLLAGSELGLVLERVVLVDEPDPQAWPTVVAALLDAFEVVVVRPTRRIGPSEQRRLLARARDRGAVLVRAGGRPDAWAEAPDLRVAVVASAWLGLGPGHGHLQARRATVEVTGRRAAARPRRADLWLPGPDGRLAPLESPSVPIAPVHPIAPAPLREVG